jgi:tRNA-uridine 2-sulfurtransferase
VSPRGRVVVAMSGGVDSSVAAAMLVEQGYEVTGITLKTYRYEDVGGKSANDTSCCSLDGINDARAVAAVLGIPHYVLDFSGRFGREIIDDFVAEYLEGRTPNPCVRCNRTIKWAELLVKADALGAGAIATGHYAQLRRDPGSGRVIVSRGVDHAKDQSYALWSVSQESLARTLLPLGSLTKPDVRGLAARFALPVAKKGESFEICFIPDNNYERFLKERVPGLEQRVDGGEVIMDGKVVGRHRGYPFYTIGQRKGIGVATGEVVYVTGVDKESNRITIGRNDDLLRRSLIAGSVNPGKYADAGSGRRVRAQIRYKDEGAGAFVTGLPDGSVRIDFDEPRRAITPGQSVVWYEGDDVVGGGVIQATVDGQAALSEPESRGASPQT